jgi:hypothetical protein
MPKIFITVEPVALQGIALERLQVFARNYSTSDKSVPEPLNRLD